MTATDILTPQQIAARINRALLRSSKIVADIRQDPDLLANVAPYLTPGLVDQLADELSALTKTCDAQ